jgi:mono/diheme cytochrome c family protein
MNNRRWFLLMLIAVLAAIGLVGTAYAQGGNVERGKQLFLKNCAVCHGDDARGRVGPSLSKDFPGIRVDLFLKQTISGGVNGSVMPAWAKDKGGPLTDAEIDDLVAFLRSLARPTPPINVTPPPTDTPRPLPTAIATFPAGDTTRGAKVFAENCVMCHGEKGEGITGASLRKDWPGINVTAFLEFTIARGVSGSRMPAWAQSNGGPLTNQQIADVTAYIRTFKPVAQATQVPAQVPTGGAFGGWIALVCAGLTIVVVAVVLWIGLAGTRQTRRK